MRIIAHRGYRAKYTENTMKAFKKAIEAGAEGIELDVHLSSDGEIVVFHDYNLKRMTRIDKAIKDLTAEELSKINLSSRRLKTERIPFLKDVLTLLKQTDLLLNIEIKAETDGILEEKLMTLLKDSDMSRIVISSFHPDCILNVKKLCPEIETALLYTKYVDQPWLLQKAYLFDAIHTDSHYTSKEYAELIQSYGIPVRIYTVNKERDLLYWLDSSIDAIITDEVELALNLKKEK